MKGEQVGVDNLLAQLLRHLTVETLAHLAADLEDEFFYTRFDKESAPPEEFKKFLVDVLTLGREMAEAEGKDFQQMVQKARAEGLENRKGLSR